MLYKFAKIIFYIYFYVFNRLVIKGKENRVIEGPTVVFANHYSNFDAFVMSLAFKRQIHYMAKKEIFNRPLIKTLAKWYGAFPVDRKNLDTGSLKTAMRILKNNKVLGIFPEGTKVRDMNNKITPKGGFTMLAYKTNSMLQPVRIKYKRKLMIFNRIDIIIDKPISFQDLGVVEKTTEEFTEIGNKLVENVYKLMD